MKPGRPAGVVLVVALALLAGVFGAVVVSPVRASPSVPLGGVVPAVSGVVSPTGTNRCLASGTMTVDGRSYYVCDATLNWSEVWFSPVQLVNVTFLGVDFRVGAYLTFACPRGVIYGNGTESGGPTSSFLLVLTPDNCLPTEPTFVSPDGVWGVNWTGGGVVELLVEASAATVTPIYPVNFLESGLALGTGWTVQLYGDVAPHAFASCTGPACPVPAAAPNGSSPFVVSAQGYSASPSSGTVTVDGSAVDVLLTFALLPGEYAVSFNASGAPSGTLSSVTLTAGLGPLEGSVLLVGGTFPVLSLALPNGSYGFYDQWSVRDQTPSPAYGNLTVDGSNVSVVVSGVPGYEVTFLDGATPAMPAGTEWFVNLTGGPSYGTTFGGLAFPEPNGTYPYTVASSDPAWVGVPGSLTVSGSSLTEDAAFSVPTSVVTFSEAGLPARTLAKDGWSVALVGPSYCLACGLRWQSWTPTVDVSVPNGSYTVLVTGPSGYAGSWTPTLAVSGARSAGVTFVQGRTYSLTFAERGLQRGQTWCVEVGGWPGCSDRPAQAFGNLTAGTYAYGVTSPLTGQRITATEGGKAVDVNGSWTVNRSTTIVESFVYRYTVVVGETGLPPGTDWSATLKGTEQTTPGSSVVFHETNGTYVARIAVSAGDSLGARTVRLLVDGANASVELTAYNLTFEEQGLNGGTSWCVKLDGGSACSTSTTVVYHEGSGTYGYRVVAVPGYTVTSSPRPAKVAGANATVLVTFTPKPSPKTALGALAAGPFVPMVAAPAAWRPRAWARPDRSTS